MERARVTWTDEQLDDLSRRIDSGFDRVGEDLRASSARIEHRGSVLGARIDRQGEELGRRFSSLEARIDGQQRTLLVLGGSTILATC